LFYVRHLKIDGVLAPHWLIKLSLD
jgi:hypothetical protein